MSHRKKGKSSKFKRIKPLQKTPPLRFGVSHRKLRLSTSHRPVPAAAPESGPMR